VELQCGEVADGWDVERVALEVGHLVAQQLDAADERVHARLRRALRGDHGELPALRARAGRSRRAARPRKSALRRAGWGGPLEGAGRGRPRGRREFRLQCKGREPKAGPGHRARAKSPQRAPRHRERKRAEAEGRRGCPLKDNRFRGAPGWGFLKGETAAGGTSGATLCFKRRPALGWAGGAEDGRAANRPGPFLLELEREHAGDAGAQRGNAFDAERAQARAVVADPAASERGDVGAAYCEPRELAAFTEHLRHQRAERHTVGMDRVAATAWGQEPASAPSCRARPDQRRSRSR